MTAGVFRDRRVLVTGGTGSIGRELVTGLLAKGAHVVRVLSRDDTKQFEMEEELAAGLRLRMLIGDVRDRSRVGRAVAGVDDIFHAAALKHVPACEFNPFEATETNVRGTQNVVEAAIDAGVERVLTISTDKAADPTNVMGATKLLAERLMIAAESFKGPSATRFAAVRFGNVIGSRGSIVPLVRTQVARGGPVTVTDPEMTRYLMPTASAIRLCFAAMERMAGGEVFILKMPRVRIGDLVEELVAAFAPQFGYRPGEIAIEVTGARTGEKRHEMLLGEAEAELATELDDMYLLSRGAQPVADAVRGGRAQEETLDRPQLRELLGTAGWLSLDGHPGA
jgi:UDP-N-acetylglucosamine 4,6-dehydratase/5-epimerase